MAKKKRSKRTRAQKKESRIAKAKNWLPTYEGTKVVRAYRKKFSVNVECAVRELQEIGYEFEPGYVENLLKAEAARIEQLRKKKAEKQEAEEYNEFQDDNFFYIAGYTSGGAPYGVQWWEVALEPWEELDYADISAPTKNIPAVPVLYSELDEEQKNEVFSRMVEMIDDFIWAAEYIPDNDDIDDILKELCGEMDDMYEILLTPDDSIRTAFNEIIEQIIAECREDGIELPTFLDTLTVTETDRLKIRQFYHNDIDNVFNMMKNPESMRDFENVFTKKKEARKWVNSQLTRYHKDGYGYFAVTLKDTAKIIGQAGFIQVETDGEKSTELVYIFDAEAFERGYAYEAAQACVDLAFNRYNIERLHCKICRENQDSIDTAERIGMSVESIFIKHHDDKETEYIIYVKNSEKTKCTKE
jgi:RimJ/RimL family protein N-acetyltransferase